MNCSNIYDKHIALFDGIGCPELEAMLGCLGARVASYRKGSYVWMAGDPLSHVGVMLSGQAIVSRNDILGNRTVLASLSQPHLFGESLICAGVSVSPVTVEAMTDIEILLISFDKIIRSCSSCCTHHNALVKNMLRIVAHKNLEMSDKLDHLSKKTTRQKVASYLISEATKKNSRRFELDMDRQALADYLCVNRSALSRELSGIGHEGIISYHRNKFIVRDIKRLESMLLTE